jgi:predicted nucleic acid-binding protein
VSFATNIRKPRVFLDASALFAGVFSAVGGARMILKLAEEGIVDLLISSQVLAEAEGALRRKAPESLAYLALLLDLARVQVSSNPPLTQVRLWAAEIAYLPDAAILAAAIAAKADYLVTLDRQHFLENEPLKARVPLRIGTPGDCLAWLRAGLGET